MKNRPFLCFHLGDLKRIIVLGAGPQLLTIADFCISNAIKLEIYTGKRQLRTKLNSGEKLFESLQRLGCSIFVCDNLESVKNGPYNTADNNTLIISFGAPFIINQKLIDIYCGRIINSHGAPLPEFRGGGGLTWRFLAADNRGVVLFHRITSIIDDGPILYRRDFEFPWPVSTVKDWLIADEIEQDIGLKDFLIRLINGEKFFEVEQDRSSLTYFPRLNTDKHGFIDFRWPGAMVARFIGAFSDPYSGASTFVGDIRIRVRSAEFIPDDSLQHPFFWGLVVRIYSGYCWVSCHGGLLKVSESAIEPFQLVKLGDRMHTPSRFIDNAFGERVVYTPKGLK